MKPVSIGLLVCALLAAPLSVLAQGASPSAADTSATNPYSPPAKAASDGKDTAAPSPRLGAPDDGASALPRAATERTTFFGLSPTAAAVIGVAFVVLVILAIVGMGRRDDTPHVDPDRRI
jgi:hypothetical protein